MVARPSARLRKTEFPASPSRVKRRDGSILESVLAMNGASLVSGSNRAGKNLPSANVCELKAAEGGANPEMSAIGGSGGTARPLCVIPTAPNAAPPRMAPCTKFRRERPITQLLKDTRYGGTLTLFLLRSR